jgi:FkbM family methyltransferase
MKILQIGCNNCDDHVFDFVKKNINNIDLFVAVDALPKCTEIAREKYEFLKQKLQVLNCAVGPANTIVEFFYPQNDKTSAHASILQSHLNSHNHQNLNSFLSPCLSINSILDFYKNSIDRLYVDMEGLDTITLQTVDFLKNKIKYIEYEDTHSDGAFKCGHNHLKLISILKSYGYSCSKISQYNSKAELI